MSPVDDRQRLVSPVPRGLIEHARSPVGALAVLTDRFPDFRCLTSVNRDGAEKHIELGNLWTQVARVATCLRASRLDSGRAVILILSTGPDLVAEYFGVMLAGGVPALVVTRSNRIANLGVYARRIGEILANTTGFISDRSLNAIQCSTVGRFRLRPDAHDDAARPVSTLRRPIRTGKNALDGSSNYAFMNSTA